MVFLLKHEGENNMAEVPKKILVVDDDAANLTVIDGILSGLYKVYPVISGTIALKFLEKQHPDLILLDIEMPEMNGIDMFNIIRSKQGLADVPVIFLTGNTDADSEAEAFRLGVSDYIRKPVIDIIMLTRVKLHLELSELRQLAGKTQ